MLKQTLPKLKKFTTVGIYRGDETLETFTDHVKAVAAVEAVELVGDCRNHADEYAGTKAAKGGAGFVVLAVFPRHLEAV